MLCARMAERKDAGPLDALVVPLGGGLLSGCVIAARAFNPGCTIFGDEPEAQCEVNNRGRTFQGWGQIKTYNGARHQRLAPGLSNFARQKPRVPKTVAQQQNLRRPKTRENRNKFAQTCDR